MALLFMDSFDHYSNADLLEKWSTTAVAGTGATTGITAGVGRRGTQGWRWMTGTPGTTTQGWIARTLTASGPTVIMGFAFMTSGFPGTQGMQIAAVRDATATLLSLRLNFDMTLTVLAGNTQGTELGTSIAGAGLLPDAFNYIEWKTTISNSGSSEVRINNVPVLVIPSADTQVATTAWTSVILGQISYLANSVGANRTVDYDDFYVSDGGGGAPWNNFLGDCRVDARVPISAGAQTEWAPTPVVPNWQNVDDAAPDDDATYNASTALFQTDSFPVQPAPVAGAPILGVQVNTSVKKADAGAASIAPVIRHLSTAYAGANVNPGTTYTYAHQVFQTIPDPGSTAWTEANFAAAQFGYKKTG